MGWPSFAWDGEILSGFKSEQRCHDCQSHDFDGYAIQPHHDHNATMLKLDSISSQLEKKLIQDAYNLQNRRGCTARSLGEGFSNLSYAALPQSD